MSPFAPMAAAFGRLTGYPRHVQARRHRAADHRGRGARLRGLLQELRERSGGQALRDLSMGMSGDFEVAIEEGATIVRVGAAIFGPRTEDGP